MRMLINHLLHNHGNLIQLTLPIPKTEEPIQTKRKSNLGSKDFVLL